VVTSLQARTDTSIANALLRAGRKSTLFRVGFLIGPAAFWIAIFGLVPLCLVIFYSFMTHGEGGVIIFKPTLHNYIRLWQSSLYRGVLLDSLVIAFESTIVTLLLGYPIAYFLGRYRGRWSNLLIVLVLLPFWTSYLVRIFAWLLLLMDTGIINWVLLKVHLLSSPLHLLYTRLGVFIGIVYSALPFAILPIYAVIRGIDEDLVDAAQVLGAAPRYSFLEVILPLSLSGIAAAAVLTYIYAAGAFLAPAILGGNSAVMVSNIIIEQFLDAANWPFASVLTVALVLAILAILFGTSRFVSLDVVYGVKN